MARAAAIAAAASALWATSASAQHEHHGVPAKLDTVKATAERVPVVLRSDATIVDVSASPAAGGSVADLLRTVPGVELDESGRITLRGGASLLVLIDGRRAALAGSALAALLRQMPAAALERVEVSTAPSARQDAEGAAGVVNLVARDDATRRTARRSLAASVSGRDFMGAAAASGSAAGLLSWDVAYSLSGTRPSTSSTTARWSLPPGDLPLHTDRDSRARETHRLHSVMSGVTVAPSPHASVALRGAFSRMSGEYRDHSAYLYTNSGGYSDASATASVMEHVIPSGELGATVTLTRGAVRFSSDALAGMVDEDVRGEWSDDHAGYRYMTSVIASRQRERAVRNDIGVHVRGIDLAVGHESRARTLTAAQQRTHFDAVVSQPYRYDLGVHAGYVSARRAIGSARTEAALRVEGERTRVRLDTASATTAVRLLPSVSGEWTDVRRALVYRLAYGRRITRPGAAMLNPFSMGEDDANEVVGNPLLRAEVSDQVELGVEWHRALLALQATHFLRWTRTPIRQIKVMTARGGTTTTLRNLESARAAGADASLRARIGGGAVVTLAGSVAHLETSDGALGSSGVYASVRLNVDMQIAEGTTAQLYAYRRGEQAIEQGEILPSFTSDLAVTQRLSRDRARVTLRLNDPFRTDRLEYRVASDVFTQASRRRTPRPLLSLFASWAVGGAPREDTPVRREGPARIH